MIYTKILQAYFLTIGFTVTAGALLVSLISGILMDGDIVELVMYFLRGLILSMFNLPILFILLLVAKKNKNLVHIELRDKLKTAHLFSVVGVWAFWNVVVYSFGIPGDFFGLVFGVTFVLMFVYSLFSWLAWTLIFNRKTMDNETIIDNPSKS